MSIFEEGKFYNKDLDEEIKEIFERIDWDEETFETQVSSYSNIKIRTLDDVLDKYAIDVIGVIDGKYLYDHCEYNLDYVELLYNVIHYLFQIVNKNIYFRQFDNNKWLRITNHINKLVEKTGYKFINIEKNKYKLLRLAEAELIDNIDNDDWRTQIGIFFSSRDIVEKEKILEWFKGHLEKNKRYYLENENEILDKKTSKDNFRKLNNWFGHKNYDSKNNENKNHYNEYYNKTNNEKNKILNDIGHWILYSLTEIERNSKS